MRGTTRQIVKWLMDQKPGLEWEIKPYKAKRSLTQNGYYWTLVGQIADMKRLPKSYVHNMMLRDYGQIDSMEGRLIQVTIPDTDAAEEQALRSETYHIKPTSQVMLGTKGQMFRTYIMLRGSHSFDTREMAVLLDGTIQEAQSLGIDTLTPAERALLK